MSDETDLTVAALKAIHDAAIKALAANTAAQIEALDRLTDSKFVTFRTLIDSEATKVALALTAADKAVSKSEVATDKRFDSVNGFQGQLRTQAATFMTRAEAEAIQTRNSERLQDLSDRLNRSEGNNTGSHTTWSVAIGVAALVTTVMVFLLTSIFR